MLENIIYPLKLRTYIYRPRQRTHTNFQLLLQFVKNVKRVTPLTVQLVYKNYHRCVAHTAHFHQTPCLCLHTLGHVHDYYYRVNGCESAERVFCEILVAGRVENIYLIRTIIEAHHRRCHRYTALLLYLHPVRSGSLLNLVTLHGPGHMDRAAKQQQLFGKSGFAGVRV